MRLRRVRIQGFRCIEDLTLNLDDVTVLVGANSTGKSSALHALRWFFDGGGLEVADVAGQDESGAVTVSATFTDFTDADKDALGRYVVEDEATFTRRWSVTDGDKLTGRGLAYPLFEQVRDHERAGERIEAYRELRDAHSELELPAARSAQAADDAMTKWETEHSGQLKPATVSATHLFGFTGQARLAGRFDFVIVPALRDPEAEAQDSRGTLLRQLLDRAIGEQATMQERLQALEADVSERMHAIVREEGDEALRTLSERVTQELVQLVPGVSVNLEARPPAFQVPAVGVDLRLADGPLSTDVGRHGHGLQRALLIALVQQLALLSGDGRADGTPVAGGDPPGLFLAIEEPELYQHPLQARHFAATLAALARPGAGPIQVAYATHSEHFVDPSRYERLRRFRKCAGAAGWHSANLTHATIERVAQRLEGIVPAGEVEARVRITLRRALAEAVFANGAVIAEGVTDAGFLQGLANRHGGFDAAGIALVNAHGKRRLLIPWAILTELGVPTYVVFDGDAGIAERMSRDGKSKGDVDRADAQNRSTNKTLLEALGSAPQDLPSTVVNPTYAVFHDTVEAEWEEWTGFADRLQTVLEELGDFRRGKSEDVYRRVATEMPSDPPPTFQQLVSAIFAVTQ